VLTGAGVAVAVTAVGVPAEGWEVGEADAGVCVAAGKEVAVGLSLPWQLNSVRVAAPSMTAVSSLGAKRIFLPPLRV
jgi:hypothetical protein